MSITNVSGLRAYDALMNASKQQSNYMQQLATGRRIVNTADDVAGAIIAESINSKLQAVNTATKSTTSGVAMLQTAETGLKTITQLLQRMRQLALQTASSSISNANRKAIQKEIDSLYKEIGNIAKTAEYNGVKLLDGSKGEISVQAGTSLSDQITIKLASASTRKLGLDSDTGTKSGKFFYTGRVDSDSASLVKTDFQLNGANWLGDASATRSLGGQAYILEERINFNTGKHGVKASAYNEFRSKPAQSGLVWSEISVLNGSTRTEIDSAASAAEFVANVNNQMDASVMRARLNADGTVTLYNNTGKQFELRKKGETSAGTQASKDHLGKFGFNEKSQEGFLKFENVDESKTTAPEFKLNPVSNKAGGGTGTKADWQDLGINYKADDGKIMAYSDSVTYAALTDDDDFRINGVQIVSTKTKAREIAAEINKKSDRTGVTASLITKKELTVAKPGTSGMNSLIEILGTNGTTAYKMWINGISVKLDGVKNSGDLIRNINEAGAGVFKAVAKEGGKIDLISYGSAITIRSYHASESKEIFQGVAAKSDATVYTYDAVLALAHKSGDHSKIKITAKNKASAAKIGFIINEKSHSAEQTAVAKAGVDVSERKNVASALEKLDKALAQVADMRGDLGANQNRLGTKLKDLTVRTTDLQASYGQIMDTDFAFATQALQKQKILAQAAQAMMQQSNRMQQMLLQLIK